MDLLAPAHCSQARFVACRAKKSGEPYSGVSGECRFDDTNAGVSQVWLKLSNMTGLPLLLLGANGELSGAPKYARPQAVAAALANHPAKVDGMIDMSRRVNDRPAVVLVSRPTGKQPAISMDKAIRLYHHPDYGQTIAALNVRLT